MNDELAKAASDVRIALMRMIRALGPGNTDAILILGSIANMIQALVPHPEDTEEDTIIRWYRSRLSLAVIGEYAEPARKAWLQQSDPLPLSHYSKD